MKSKFINPANDPDVCDMWKQRYVDKYGYKRTRTARLAKDVVEGAYSFKITALDYIIGSHFDVDPNSSLVVRAADSILDRRGYYRLWQLRRVLRAPSIEALGVLIRK